MITAARTVSLAQGFNLETWSGPSETAIGAALNTVGDLDYGDALWVNVEATTTWQQPAPPLGGVVTSGDGDAANNFRALPDFPFDFFDSTDQWYELEFTQSDTWRVEKRSPQWSVLNDLATGAMVMVAGDAVYFIPQDEFSVPMGGELGFRVTAFRTRARARWRPWTRGRPPATCIRAWGSRWRHWCCPGAGGPPRPRLPRPEGPA